MFCQIIGILADPPPPRRTGFQPVSGEDRQDVCPTTVIRVRARPKRG